MARQYREQISTPNGAGLGQLQTPNVQTGIGQALQSTGDQLFAVGSHLQDMADREAIATADANISRSSAWAQEQVDSLRTAPADEVEKRREQILKDWQKQRSDITSKARTPAVRDFTQQHIDRLETAIHSQTGDIANEARTLRTIDQQTQALNERARVVESDPTQLEKSVADQSYVASRSLLNQQAQAAMHGKIVADLSLAALRGNLKKDPKGTLAELQNPQSEALWMQGITPDQRQKAIGVAENAITEQAIDGATSTIMAAFGQSVSKGNASLAALNLPEDQANTVRQKVHAQFSLLQDERSRAAHDEVVGLARKIDQGFASPADIRHLGRLYDQAAITEAQHLSYIDRYDAARKASAERVQAQQDIANIFAAGLPLDPTSSAHRKALDLTFSASVGQIPAGDPRWKAQARALAGQTRMLPDSAMQWTRQAMRSPDPKQRADAAMFFADVEATTPEAIMGFDAQTKAYAGLVSSMVNAGADPLKAADQAAELTYKITPQVREFRKTQYTALAKQSPESSAVTGFIGQDFNAGLFHSNSAASQALVSDFGMQRSRYFELTGDLNAASAMAWRDVKQVYGPSKVNGESQMMMMPPERFGVSPDAVRADIADWLKSNPQADGSAAEDVHLVPDATTQRNVFGLYDGQPVRPSYKVVGKGGDILIGADGLPVVYTLPSERDIAAKANASKVLTDNATAVQNSKEVAIAKDKRQLEQTMKQYHELGML
jgi:hypothetical protein